jgi:hypothetical protein
MKKIKLVLVIIVLAFMLTSCEQFFARRYGGQTTIELDKGQKLIEVTWKDDDLWYLVEPMKPNDTPRTLEFIERSNYGVLEGKVIFIESK